MGKGGASFMVKHDRHANATISAKCCFEARFEHESLNVAIQGIPVKRKNLGRLRAEGWAGLCLIVAASLLGRINVVALAEEAKQADASPSDVPLYEQPPYDLIYLNAANDNAVLKVSPLPFPDRKTPSPLPRSGFLEVELFDRPGERFRAAWPQIVRIQLFEEILVEEAGRLIDQRNFSAAWDYIEYLHANYPRVQGLETLRQRFWFEEAAALIEQKQFDRAYGNLRNLFAENRDYPGLSEVAGRAVDGLVDRYLERSDYAAARQVVDGLAALFPQHPVVASRRRQFQAEAASLLAEAEAALQRRDFRQADLSARRMMAVWPELPGAADCLRRVQTAYPRLRVGVTLAAKNPDPASLTDWSARRSGRLVARCWAEWSGIGPEGGIYATPFHSMRSEDLGRRLVFTVTASDRGTIRSGPIASDLAELCWAMGSADDRRFFLPWADLAQELAAGPRGELIVQLRRPHVRPEVFLRQAVTCRWAATANAAADASTTRTGMDEGKSAASRANGVPELNERFAVIGPYVLDSDATSNPPADVAVLLSNNAYDERTPGRPAEIDEVPFARGRDALAALRRGDLDAVDRVNPWERGLVEGQADLELRKYAAPLVHMLVPNLSRPLPADRDFRRALLLGIDRERILRMLLDGRSEEGCRVISGPFPVGTKRADPLGYAYDADIEPRAYQPAAALALVQVAAAQARDTARKQGRPIPEGNAIHLRLPPHEIAREACREIARQWRLLGLDVRLIEASPGDATPASDTWDFMYVEAAMWEPAGDVFRLFSLPMFDDRLSPYVTLSLARVMEAADWPEMSARLRAVHRAVHDDVAVLPLYQLEDYFVIRKGIEAVPPRPAVLYQDVENWRVVPRQ